MPLGKGDLIAGYALAFGAVAVLQSLLATGLSVWALGLDVMGSPWLLLLVAVLDALLGTALGLFVSAFAASEFQAVQFMPAVIFPQLLLCGLFIPRDRMAPFLEAVSDVLPMSYAVDGMNESFTTPTSPAIRARPPDRGRVRPARPGPRRRHPPPPHLLTARCEDGADEH